ncbi:MAG: hypothetical protein KIT25_20025 [Enhydrobacter sp.]|nr:MAG: hypothetical protein KIT25_20025 [Enhydrobacter sp.]
MIDVPTTLRKELAELEAKAAKIRALLLHYPPAPGVRLRERTTPVQVSALAAAPPVANGAPRPAYTPGAETKFERARKAAVSLAQERGGTVHRLDMLNRLKELGIMGTETNPMQTLAKFLTEWSTDFERLGGGSYRLRNKAD